MYVVTVCLTRSAMLKVTGHLQKSTEIMKLSNNLIKIPQMSQSMREMSAELMKVCACCTYNQAGILEEMMQDTLDASILGEDQDEIEEAAQGEVEQVLYELTDGRYTHIPLRDRSIGRGYVGLSFATARHRGHVACRCREHRRDAGRSAGLVARAVASLRYHTLCMAHAETQCLGESGLPASKVHENTTT